jgi:cysteine-rich repeat protein
MLVGCRNISEYGSTGMGDTTGVSGESSVAMEDAAEGAEHAAEHAEAAEDGADPPGGEASAGDTSSTGVEESAATSAGTTGEQSVCGDGVINSGEECDNGFAANSDDAVCLAFCTLARCGDGHVFVGKEECDDQNFDPLDGCDLCGKTRRVFITSEGYSGAIFLGIEGADQRCRSLAAQAGLPNASKFKAWLSDSRTSARERLYSGRGRYELINGLLVAKNWASLLDGELLHPINVTEKSETREIGVWTSTNPDGSAAEGTDHCADWSEGELENTAFWGASSEITADWTIADSPANPQECGSHRALYCFEQE